MIINKNINPERDLYYLGAKVIEILYASNEDKFDYYDVYKKLKNKNDISIKLYFLTLDWLFILRVIKKSKNGNIEKIF